MDALELLRRYTHRERVVYYDPADRVPLDGWSGRIGARRSWTSAGGWSGSRTSCACSPACATLSAPARSGYRARVAGATPRPTCPSTSRRTARRTTPRSASPRTRPRSSTSSAPTFTEERSTLATREILPRERVRRLLLLTLFALGTNMGIAKIAAAGEHGETEHTLRRTRHTHINRDNLRRVGCGRATPTPRRARGRGRGRGGCSCRGGRCRRV
jgi:hypothetical protein